MVSKIFRQKSKHIGEKNRCFVKITIIASRDQRNRETSPFKIEGGIVCKKTAVQEYVRHLSQARVGGKGKADDTECNFFLKILAK